MAVDPLDDLKRLAYGRDVDAATAATAQAELARLDADRLEATRREAEAARLEAEPARPPAEPEWPATRASGRLLLGLAAATLAATVLAVAVPLVPERSLAVFDEPQTARDLEVPAELLDYGVTPSTIRYLGRLDEVDAYGYLNASGYVCVGVVGPGGVSGSCTSRERFSQSGIVLLATTGPVTGVVEVRWGPFGDASLAFAPALAAS